MSTVQTPSSSLGSSGNWNSDALFQHQPLQEDHFRLLSLLPRTESDPLSFTLEHHYFRSGPPFYAISYSWDGQRFTRLARCNGKATFMTPTIIDFLCMMEENQQMGPFWIDAVSIDQFNPIEKATEVQNIHLYFSKAVAVYAWLGPGNAFVDAFIDHIPVLVEAIDRSGPWQEQETSTNWLPESNDVWKGLRDTLNCTWFQRLWILQEALVNVNVHMYYGRRFCELSTLRHLCVNGAFAAGDMLARPADLNVLEFLVKLEQMRSDLGTNGGIDILDLLPQCQIRQVSIEVDRVYGMLGLMRPATRRQITVDYSAKSTADPLQLYRDVGHILLQEDFHMTALQRASLARSTVRLPSWCPDLGVAPDFFTLPESLTYLAGGNAPRTSTDSRWTLREFQGTLLEHDPHPWLACSLDKSRILMRGLQVGTITKQGAAPPLLSDMNVDPADDFVRIPNYLVRVQDAMQLFKQWISFCLDLETSTSSVHDAEYTPYQLKAILYCPWGSHVDPEALTWDVNDLRLPAVSSPCTSETKLQSWYEELLMYMEIFQSSEGGLGDRYSVGQAKKWNIHLLFNLFFNATQIPFKVSEKSGTYIGLGPSILQVGDVLAIFRYTRVPFILRQCAENADRWQIVGQTYTEGLMHGEAFEQGTVDEERLFWIE